MRHPGRASLEETAIMGSVTGVPKGESLQFLSVPRILVLHHRQPDGALKGEGAFYP